MYPLIHITETIFFPSYLVIISFLYCLCTYWIYVRSRKLGLGYQTAMDISIAIMIGGLVGSRLLHVIFEYPQYYIENPAEIFKVWEGGFVFYGGLLGGFLAAFWIVRRKKENPFAWMDAFAPLLAIGYGIGRLGCLLAGCCYGMECDLPWAIQYPDSIGSPPAGVLRHPVPIYDLIASVFIFGILFGIEKFRIRLPSIFKQPGALFFVWMILFGIQRIVMEDLRDDYRGPALLGLTISTVISIFLITLGIFLIWKRNTRRTIGRACF